MLDSFRASEKFIKGQSGELQVAGLLQARGWYIIPSYDYSGDAGNKAPRLQGQRLSFVVPDLNIAREGKRLWAEVKTKAAATFTHITRQLEHGIPTRHLQDYLKIQEITGCEVWLFIFEEDTRAVLTARLAFLLTRKREYVGPKMSNGGMVFFPRSAFTHFATLPVLI